ncbi:MAG: hypothetical protein HQL93_09015 [Magnetococcales bacterium]|nr:hypothetical protein [Magnetococcales bacterium]
MSSGFTSPFIGNDQNINPWNFWTKFTQQSGFINIHTTQAGDAELERKIIENVASYGRQLGILMDFLAVVAKDEKFKHLEEADQRAAYEKFNDLVQKVNATKNNRDAKDLLEDLKSLKKRDKQTFDTLVKKIVDL